MVCNSVQPHWPSSCFVGGPRSSIDGGGGGRSVPHVGFFVNVCEQRQPRAKVATSTPAALLLEMRILLGISAKKPNFSSVFIGG